MHTLSEVINFSINSLAANNIADSRRNAELIICYVLNFSNIDLITRKDEIITDQQIESINRHISDRIGRVPLQYILGSVPFNDIILNVNASALIPRPETEFLTAWVIEQNYNKINEPLHILDICTGTGCIALSLAKSFRNAVVDGIDISKPAIELANENKKTLDIKNVNFIELDIKSDTKKIQHHNVMNYDLIVANPPYISQIDYENLQAELYYEPKIALTDEASGITFYECISKKINILLNENGKLYFECGINQSKNICDIYEQIGYNTAITKDFNKIARYITIWR